MLSSSMKRARAAAFALVALLVALATSPTADAFCGFYVGGAGAKLFNDATVVVMMREGTRTVLSMQNAYKGPPEKFAMVVPVPVVLQEENVKTLPRELFDKVDQLAAPRLVEYWEQDPCAQGGIAMRGMAKAGAPMPAAPAAAAAEAKDFGVTIEAQFTVGEYQVVILSAKDSGGLDAWLHAEQYSIPEGAEPYFRPYVAAGSKFFVAKVDITKVKMENGMAALSPLRFHYDSDTFTLPVRLGLINSSGTQDLLVHVLARGKRYEVANYPNVTIPTNLDVAESARDAFPTFYTTLFDRTLAKNPKAVVTEYSWDSGSCDPCPGPALSFNDLATLGADVLPSSAPPPPMPVPPPMTAPKPVTPPPAPTTPSKGVNCDPPYTIDATGRKQYKMECLNGPSTNTTPTAQAPAKVRGGIAAPGAPPAMPQPMMPSPGRGMFFGGGSFTITRLHARYTKDSLGEDLVFREAPAITGGRETMGHDGKLEHGSSPAAYGGNNFQARYAVRHAWSGPIACKEPRRGVWGGPPGGGYTGPKAAQKIGLAPRNVKADLASFVKQDVPEIGFARGSGSSPMGATPVDGAPRSVNPGCSACAIVEEKQGSSGALAAGLAGAAIAIALRLRRRARPRR